MRYFHSIFIVALSVIFLLGIPIFLHGQLIDSVLAQQLRQGQPWTGKTGEGTVITQKDLALILDKHIKWLATEKGGAKADLKMATLGWANLRGANLIRADLAGPR